MKRPFANAKRKLKALDRSMAELRKQVVLVLEAGKQGGEAEHRNAASTASQLTRQLDECLRVRAALRQMMPPFMTEKDGVFIRHPVTDENKHLLWE